MCASVYRGPYAFCYRVPSSSSVCSQSFNSFAAMSIYVENEEPGVRRISNKYRRCASDPTLLRSVLALRTWSPDHARSTDP